MLKSILKITKDIGLLTIALTFALVGNLVYAQWSNPTAAPTGANTPAPLNVGTDVQRKYGGLELTNLTLRGAQRIESTYPRVEWRETDGDRWWTMVNSSGSHNRFWFLSDRNRDGGYGGERPPLYLTTYGSTPNYDSATFSNQVRANAYCDRSGRNCARPSQIAPAVLGRFSGQVRAAAFCDRNGRNCITPAQLAGLRCQTVPYIRTIVVPYIGGSRSVGCGTGDWACMNRYCRETYGAGAGYHAAYRGSLNVFSCYDWDTTSTCRNVTITPNRRAY